MELPAKEITDEDEVIVRQGSTIFKFTEDKVSTFKLKLDIDVSVDFIDTSPDSDESNAVWVDSDGVIYKTSCENILLAE